MNLVGLVEKFKRFVAKQRLKRQRFVVSDQEAGRQGLTMTHRVCDLFDLFEYSRAQRTSVVLSSVSEEHRRLLLSKMPSQALHAASRQALLQRRATTALQSAILSDFLGLELSEADGEHLEHLRTCLANLVDKESGVVAADIMVGLLEDPEAARVGDSNTQYYFLDLMDAHKVALILWLTGHQRESALEPLVDERGRLFIRQGRSVLSQLNQRTKLRVLRECLELPLSETPKPSDQEGFGRLALALNTVHRADPSKFFQGVLELWPHVSVNPLIIKMVASGDLARRLY